MLIDGRFNAVGVIGVSCIIGSKGFWNTGNSGSDKDKLSGLKDVVDLGGGETKPQTTPVDHFGVVLSVNTTDNLNYAHVLTIDFGSVA